MCEEQVLLNWFYPENQLCSARLDQSQSSAAPPPRPTYDAGARAFVANLARAGKSFAEIKKQWTLPTGTEPEHFANLPHY